MIDVLHYFLSRSVAKPVLSICQHLQQSCFLNTVLLIRYENLVRGLSELHAVVKSDLLFSTFIVKNKAFRIYLTFIQLAYHSY